MKNQFSDAFTDIFHQYLGREENELSNSEEVVLCALSSLPCYDKLDALARKTFHELIIIGPMGADGPTLCKRATVTLKSSRSEPYTENIKAMLHNELCYGIGNGKPYLVNLVAALAIEEDGRMAILVGDEYIDDESDIITFTGRSTLDLFDERIAEELLISVFQDLVGAKDTYKEQTIEEIEQ